MLTIHITGSFDGYEESKSQPGMFHIYVMPKAMPEAGFLKTVTCTRDYGAALQASQKIGNFAILCKPEDIPALEIGQLISLTAECWPISRPVWSERMNNIIWTYESSPVYMLKGKISQPDKAVIAPPQFVFDGIFKAGQRKGDLTNTQCLLIDNAPEGLCRQVRVKKGRGFVTSEERLGTIVIRSKTIPALTPQSPVTAKGILWPIVNPYYNKDTEAVTWKTIPEPHMIATEFKKVEAKGK